MAKLRFYYGCMGAAKTLRLLTTSYNFEENNIEVVILNPHINKRDGEGYIASRIGIKRECITIMPTDNIMDLVQHIKENDKPNLKWILIDECQFLTKDQVDQLACIVDTLGIDIMCFGLRTDFSTTLFPGSKRLFEIADTIEEVKSTCSCGNKNIVNARINDNGDVVFSGEQVVIGGNETYTSMCRKCWNKLKGKDN